MEQLKQNIEYPLYCAKSSRHLQWLKLYVGQTYAIELLLDLRVALLAELGKKQN